MNSIESHTSAKVALMDDEPPALSTPGSDPAALEMLRAMMGGAIPQQSSIPALSCQPSSAGSTAEPPARLLSLLSRALADDTLPASLAPLIKSLRQSLEPETASSTLAGSLEQLRAAIGGQAPETTMTSTGSPAPTIAQPQVVEQMKQLFAALNGLAVEAPATSQPASGPAAPGAADAKAPGLAVLPGAGGSIMYSPVTSDRPKLKIVSPMTRNMGNGEVAIPAPVAGSAPSLPLMPGAAIASVVSLAMEASSSTLAAVLSPAIPSASVSEPTSLSVPNGFASAAMPEGSSALPLPPAAASTVPQAQSLHPTSPSIIALQSELAPLPDILPASPLASITPAAAPSITWGSSPAPGLQSFPTPVLPPAPAAVETAPQILPVSQPSIAASLTTASAPAAPATSSTPNAPLLTGAPLSLIPAATPPAPSVAVSQPSPSTPAISWVSAPQPGTSANPAPVLHPASPEIAASSPLIPPLAAPQTGATETLTPAAVAHTGSVAAEEPLPSDLFVSDSSPARPAYTLSPTTRSTLQDIRSTLAQALTAPDKEHRSKPSIIDQRPDEASLGQSILQSLSTQSSRAVVAPQPGSAPNQATIPHVERVEQVSALMSEMVDRVLVTDPVHGQTPEVRIKIAEHIMPETEVRVTRTVDGQLRVEFETVSPYWARVLNEASPLLAQRLNEQLPLGTPAQVIVQDQGGQPQDGRSRNRQTPWDLARQSAEG